MATECSWNDGSKAQYYVVILDRLLGRSGGLEQAPEWHVRGPLTPMNVDTVQKMYSLPLRGCYWCEEANHLVKNCHHHLDIQRLTTEQREELIEDLMALKDVVEKEEVCLTLEEDFA